MTRPARHSRSRRRSLIAVFAIPAALLATTLAGLVIGLTGDGAPDAIAWALLAIPLLTLALAWLRRG